MSDIYFARSADLPAELFENRWLPWKPDGRNKVPIGRDGKPCDPSNPRYWLPLIEAGRASQVFGDSGARVGYALTGSGLAVLDFDGVIDVNTGVIAPDVSARIDKFDTYTELSPSGLGLHAILAADLPFGNRRMPGLELLTSGFVTVTGHPLKRRPIKSGGEALQRIVDALPPPQNNATAALTIPLPTPLPGMVADLIARAMPNARFRKLLSGDWTEYESRSEADGAFCMHLARNGGNLVCIVAALRQSGLSRRKLRRDDYVYRTALFATSTANIRVPNWRGVDLSVDVEAVALAKRRLDDSVLFRDAPLLLRIAAFITNEIAAGRSPDVEGNWRISPAILASVPLGDPEPIMTRQGCWKALHRLADRGLFSLHSGVGDVRIGGATRQGKVTLIQVAGSDILSIVDGFLRRATNKTPPPVYVVSTNARVPRVKVTKWVQDDEKLDSQRTA